MAWKGYVVSDRAMVNPSAAWEDALKLRSYELDQAISQSQVLYFAGTMDGFKPPKSSSSEEEEEIKPGTSTSTSGSKIHGESTSESAACDQHPKCAELELMGNCCPASNGVFLGCCGNDQGGGGANVAPLIPQDAKSTSSSTTATSTRGDSSTSSPCASNKACADLGLSGLCCPASNGVFLGCCGEKNSDDSNPSESSTTTTDAVTSTKPTTPTVTTTTSVDDKDNEEQGQEQDEDSSSSALCSANKFCADLGLSGLCCPTSGGQMLGCCN